MENLESKIEEIQIQAGVFGDLCEFVHCAIGAICGEAEFMERYQNALLPSVMQTLTNEARRIEKHIDEFNDLVSIATKNGGRA